jgi:hypothetical protein
MLIDALFLRQSGWGGDWGVTISYARSACCARPLIRGGRDPGDIARPVQGSAMTVAIANPS